MHFEQKGTKERREVVAATQFSVSFVLFCSKSFWRWPPVLCAQEKTPRRVSRASEFVFAGVVSQSQRFQRRSQEKRSAIRDRSGTPTSLARGVPPLSHRGTHNGDSSLPPILDSLSPPNAGPKPERGFAIPRPARGRGSRNVLEHRASAWRITSAKNRSERARTMCCRTATRAEFLLPIRNDSAQAARKLGGPMSCDPGPVCHRESPTWSPQVRRGPEPVAARQLATTIRFGVALSNRNKSGLYGSPVGPGAKSLKHFGRSADRRAAP
jgi:hypothetical protein